MTQDEFLAAALRNPVNPAITGELDRLGLPDAWLVAGCLVQRMWNVLTTRPLDHGISDYDVFYFDSDTSWEAEDAVIRDLTARLGHLGAAIEVRKVGLERWLYRLAFDQPLLYGLMSLAVAVIAGWGASAAFRKLRRA